MKKLFAMILALAMVLALCACGTASKTQPTKEPNEIDKPETTQEAKSTEPVKAEIQSATDELVGKYASVEEFDRKPDEYAQKLLITVSGNVTELKVYDLAYVEQGDVFAFTPTEVYSASAFTADKPLTVWVSIPGVVPTMGFSYVDADGAAKYFAIEESGKDGSPLLTELTIAEDGTLAYKQAE